MSEKLVPKEETSVGIITYSIQEMAVGEKVFMSKFDTWEIEGVSQPVDLDRCAGDIKCRIITEEEYKGGMENPYCEVEEMKKMEKQKSRFSVFREKDKNRLDTIE